MYSQSKMIAFAIVCWMATCSSVFADEPLIPYDLGNLGGRAFEVKQISETGEIVGLFEPDGATNGFPFYWSQQTGMVNLGSCCGGGYANYITDDGMVIGEENGPADRLAFYWTPSGGRVNIPLHYGNFQVIKAVNSKSGMVIGGACSGSAARACTDTRGFVWTKNGGIVDLGAGCYPTDINDSDQVVGYCGASAGTAFIWTEQQGKHDIVIEGQDACFARAINNAGQVVGNCITSLSVSSVGPAFVWAENDGGITFSYPGLESSGRTNASKINDAGLVAGEPAFAWTNEGGIVVLEPPGVQLTAAGMNLLNPGGPQHGLSESGHIFLVGNLIDEFTGALTNHVYVWHEDTGYEDLGGGNQKPAINSWNDLGVAVGYQFPEPGPARTYFWTPNRGARLADCLVVGAECIGQSINNRGQIAGTAKPAIGNPPSRFALWNTDPGLPPVALGDLNGNGSPDLGIMIRPGNHVQVRDGSTDALISGIDFGADAAIQMAALPDMDSSGDPEIAILNVRTDGHVRVQIRDSVSGNLVKYLWYGLQYAPVSMTVVPDYSGNGAPEIAVLGSEASTDAVRVQLRDSSSSDFIDNVFLGTQSLACDLVSVTDNSGNGIPEIGILGVLKGNDQVRSQLWDADTAAFQTNVWFGNNYQPQSMITMPDINTNGSEEIVVVGVDPATRQVRVQVRDSASAATHYNIWLGNVNRAVDIALINDINGDGFPDLAVLLRTPDGTGRVRVQDGLTGAFIRNLFYTVVENPVGLAVMPDYSGNGFDELAVFGDNAGVRHVQILDTSSGSQINRIDFP